MNGWRSDTEKHDDARKYVKDLEENRDNEEVENEINWRQYKKADEKEYRRK
jgi:hypothetical protein